MSKEENVSPPPVKNLNTVTSLPPLPDDFLSFQPQSFARNSTEVDNVLEIDSPDNIRQVQQQGSDRGRGKGRGYYNNNARSYHGNKRGSYHGGYQQYYGEHNLPSRRGNNFGGGGGGGGGNYYNYRTPGGGQQQRGGRNNYESSKKRRFNEKNKSNGDISSYYKKSFLENPWTDLIKTKK